MITDQMNGTLMINDHQRFDEQIYLTCVVEDKWVFTVVA